MPRQKASIRLVCMLRSWKVLFGPILVWELVRTARRGHYLLLRSCYALFLLALLFAVYVGRVPIPSSLTEPLRLSGEEASRFAHQVFIMFIWAQFWAVVALTPVYVAGTIIEEKERRTLEFLFVTDLSSLEIVLGKLFARLAHVAMVLLTGLPVLALLQLLGGVDPNLLLMAFALTGLTMLSLGSLSILFSVLCKTGLSAVFDTYFLTGLYLVGSSCIQQFPALGNPVVGLMSLEGTWFPGQGASGSELEVLVPYVLFHGIFAAICCIAAASRLRQAGTEGKPKRAPSRGRVTDTVPAATFRSEVSDDGLLWKETRREQFSAEQWKPSIGAKLALWVVIPGLVVLGRVTGEFPCLIVLGPVTGIGILWSSLLLIMVALSAAGRFSIETRQRTLETLLTIPEREAIFPSKWRGSVLHVRRGWWILVWLLFMGLLADLNPLRVVLVVASWFASAALLASLGLSFSIITGSTTRATIFTLLSALLVGMGSTALAGWLIDPIMNIKHTPQGTLFLFATLAPPVTAWLNASSSYFFSLDPSFAFFLSLPGIAFHAIAAWVIFRFGSACFRMVAEPLAFRLQSPTRPFPP